MEFEQTKRILAAFDQHRVDYVLIGGMAMAAQGLVRATRDIDVVVSADAKNIDRLKTALKAVFDDPEVDSIRADELAGDYPAIQYVPPTGDFWIDILARHNETFRTAGELMPVRKFRSVAEMPPPPPLPPLDPRNFKVACDLSVTAARLCAPHADGRPARAGR
jgi:hypothetical protein